MNASITGVTPESLARIKAQRAEALKVATAEVRRIQDAINAKVRLCPRCGKRQTITAYCVEWKEKDCIRMESVAVLPSAFAAIKVTA